MRKARSKNTFSVNSHVFKKWEATKNIALRKYYFLMGGDTEQKIKKHTHDNSIVLVVRDFSFGGGMVHAYCRSVTIFSSDLQRCVMPSHANNNIARPVI